MPRIVSPVAGTRIEPPDSYSFLRGSTAIFKATYTSQDRQITIDANTQPYCQIFAPEFLNPGGAPLPQVLATINGTLVPGQEFEYQFIWDIPTGQFPTEDYIVSYYGYLSGILVNFGDEYFNISGSLGPVGIRRTGFCTVDDIRQKKFNIDDYLPKVFAQDLEARNQLILTHIIDGTNKLREELNLAKKRQITENYRLFTIYYTIWSLMLAARGEDGSSVSDQNLATWKSEWQLILAQEKRQSVLQGVPLGRG